MAQVLRPLTEFFPLSRYPELLVGLEDYDDAAVYQLDDHTALIHTLDFFTPVVDDPYDYGAIAAANALSDIYAMGGEVLVALNICCFPQDLPESILKEIIRGGAEKVHEAGGVIAGGHTIQDKEPKYGLSVLGRIHPGKILTKSKAREGDTIVLTKPLGTGLITTAAKGDMAEPGHVDAAVKSMKQLNKTASTLIQETGVHGCTDVTGYALLGHGYEIAEKSNIRLCINVDALPILDGALQYAENSLFPAGTCRNRDYFKEHVEFAGHIDDDMQMLLFTPETSGGLLFTVSRDKVDEMKQAFLKAGEFFRIIGEVTGGHGICVR
jgi:selenide,water dikinase